MWSETVFREKIEPGLTIPSCARSEMRIYDKLVRAFERHMTRVSSFFVDQDEMYSNP